MKTKTEVSKALKLNIQELKEFEAEGLFEFADKAKRNIDGKNFERLRIAASLKKELGVNPAGIEIILNMREKLSRMRNDINAFLSQVRERLEGQFCRDLKKLKDEVD